MSTSTDPFHYWAFISYSSKDVTVAKKIHKRLETYRIPRGLRGSEGRDGPIPKKLFPIFRDREELPLSSDLGNTIEDALSASRYLIVLCSPHSAQSRWVNEEIRYFKSLGRENRILAIILDGEPNASDDPNADQPECFPQALRYKLDRTGTLTDKRTEPIGGDLREGGDGWTSVYLKAVAGITGLSYDAFVRREQKRKRVRQTIAATIGLLVIIAGLWIWDYYRLKTSYYANLSTVWSLPVGIGKLEPELRAGRQYHYRIKSSQGKIRRIARVNSAGVLRDDEQEHNASVSEMVYGEDGSLQQINLKDHNGKLVLRKDFSDLKDSSGVPFRIVKFVQQHDEAPLSMSSNFARLDVNGEDTEAGYKSEITAHQIRYDAQGRVHKITYHNNYGENRANTDGIYGQRFFYDDGKLPIRIENLGHGGQSFKDKAGIVALRMYYNSLGDNLRRQYLGANGRPVANAQNVAGSVVKRDTFGNIVEGVHLGINAQPVLYKQGGFHRWTQQFDAKGNRTHQSYFGTNWQQPVLHTALGAHSVEQAYDKRGNVTKQAYFGINGRRVVRSDLRYHMVRQTYDDRDNAIEYRFFGIEGEPVPRNDIGVHSIIVTFTEGNAVKQEFLNSNRKKTLHKDDGYHMWKRSYDKHDNITSSSYYGIGGKPIIHQGIGAHRWSGRYNRHNNLSEERYYGIHNEAVLRKDRGYHRLKRVFDAQGNPVRITFFDVSNTILSRYCRNKGEWAACQKNSLAQQN